MASIDIPPPPYTETDIYSASSGSGSRRASSLRPDDSVSRGVAPTLSTGSTTSSTSEIIYTPPETPHTSQFDSLNTADQIPGSSAAAYFSARSPWPYLATDSTLTHSITIRRDTRPDDVPYPPYPQILESRDVQHQDWKTFLNYLLPNHTSESNSAIIDRKVREEGDDVRSQVASDHLGGKRPKSKSPREPGEWKEHARTTVREWNEGFFHPRGIDIVLNLPGETREPDIEAPGAWRSSYDPRQDGPSSPGRRGGRFGGLLGRLTASLTAPENYNQRDARSGLRLGRVVIDEDGVSIGDRFEANGNGLRLGGFVGRGRGPPSCGPSGPFGGPRGDWRREGRGGPFGLAGPFAGVRGPAHHPSGHDAPAYDGGRGFGRGRRHDGDEKGKGRHRSRSSSSSSSSSSCSSSSSAESVGSLPAYEDLNDNQLPLTRDFLQKWLDHPEQPVTRESLKQVKSNLKAASKTRSPSSAGAQTPLDRAALRKEVRAMMGEWKALRKSQKRDRRATKRERRETRRAAKRERRETRREGKRERRQARREARRGPATAAWPGRGGFLDRFGEAGYASVGRANLGRPSSHREGVVSNAARDDHKTELALLERQIAEKGRQLVQVHEEISREQEEGGTGRGSVKGEGKRMSPAVRKALELEREIDLAVRKLEIVRAQSDERLARELAALEIARGR